MKKMGRTRNVASNFFSSRFYYIYFIYNYKSFITINNWGARRGS